MSGSLFPNPHLVCIDETRAENPLALAPGPFYFHAAISDNTRKAYRRDTRHFIAWGGLLPTAPDKLLHYLQDHAGVLNPRTLKRRLTAIKQWHVLQGLADPTLHPSISKTLVGISRVHGRPPEKAPPLSIEQLSLLVNHLTSQGQLVDWRDNALLQIGFFGAFRRSELVAIHWQQVNFVPEGIDVLIPRSKTDQTGKGHVCSIPYGNKTLCPVTALQTWQAMSGISSGAVFRSIHHGVRLAAHAVSPGALNGILKKHALACQLPQAKNYSGHSLRRGFASSASQKGATLGAIMRQGRWRHEGTVNGYIAEGQRFEANAAGLMLEKFSSPLVPDTELSST